MVLVCSCSNWGHVSDRIRLTVLFAGKSMVYEIGAVNVPVVVDIQAQ